MKLYSASDNEHYNIIINKLSKVAHNCLIQDNVTVENLGCGNN